ncbi:hypothetical protein B0H14DRAFT_3146403 [Mycena olivaceomarginata]|nr:hypothetical protein B0H14DRAFT_3146403 [Mycena olivaceomarginata]
MTRAARAELYQVAFSGLHPSYIERSAAQTHACACHRISFKAEGAGRGGAGSREQRGEQERGDRWSAEHEARAAGVGVGGGCRCGRSDGGRAGARRRAGVRGEQERCRAASITQYRVFCTLQYQTILDDKNYLWSPILAPSSTVWHRVVSSSIGRVDFCYSDAPRY